jgi:adenylosuccinate lyase
VSGEKRPYVGKNDSDTRMAMTETGEEGKGRHEVHELVRKASMEAQHPQEDFKKVLVRTKDILGTLSERELEAAFDPEHYPGVSGKTVDRILGIVGGAGNQ